MTNILIFEVMVMDDNILLKTIEKHNQAFNTDFLYNSSFKTHLRRFI